MAKTTGLEKLRNMGYGFYQKYNDSVAFAKTNADGVTFLISINSEGACNKYYDTTTGLFGSKKISKEEENALIQYKKEQAAA
jgi:hypothetical protein